MDWRHKARILAMQALVQLDVQGDSFLSELDPFIAEADAPGKSKTLCAQLVRNIFAAQDTYDQWIAQTVRHWQLSRIAAVDRAILRLAVHEILDRPDVPPKVAIDEAIELAKTYSTGDSAQFINGVLDGIYRRMQQAADQSAKAPPPSHPAASEPQEDNSSTS